MPDAPPFLKQRPQVDPPLPHCRREIQRRRRHRKTWRFHLEQPPDHVIRHLIVSPAADAVHKLICHEEPQECRQRQRPWSKSNLLLATPANQPRRRLPSIRSRIKNKLRPGSHAQLALSRGVIQVRSRARHRRQIIHPERRLHCISRHLQIRHRPRRRPNRMPRAIVAKRPVVLRRKIPRPRHQMMHENQIRLRLPDRRHQ